jgi:hypothetical protein
VLRSVQFGSQPQLAGTYILAFTPSSSGKEKLNVKGRNETGLKSQKLHYSFEFREQPASKQPNRHRTLHKEHENGERKKLLSTYDANKKTII